MIPRGKHEIEISAVTLYEIALVAGGMLTLLAYRFKSFRFEVMVAILVLFFVSRLKTARKRHRYRRARNAFALFRAIAARRRTDGEATGRDPDLPLPDRRE